VTIVPISNPPSALMPEAESIANVSDDDEHDTARESAADSDDHFLDRGLRQHATARE
jgi:hypothetical protein